MRENGVHGRDQESELSKGFYLLAGYLWSGSLQTLSKERTSF